MKSINNIKENENNNNKEQENELVPINLKNKSKIAEKYKLLKQRKIIEKRLFIIWTFISIISIGFYINYSLVKINKNRIPDNIFNDNNKEILQIPGKYKIHKKNESTEKQKKKNKNNKYVTTLNVKIGVAFVFESMYGNGIGRMLSILFNELAKYDKYEMYLLSRGRYRYDFKFNRTIKEIAIYGNRTKIKKFNDETPNLKYYVLNNEIDPRNINWFKSLGKKVIDINHGTYLSCVYANCTGVYKAWANQKLFDAYIQVVVDDYYVYKKLGFNNSFYIPNMFTFDADKTPNSNLTYKNLMIMGREHDRIKGGYYGIKAMYEIVKEIPDAKLYFISADYKIDF